MPRIVLTGAAGAIGTVLRAGLAPNFPDMVCTDLKRPTNAPNHERWVEADIADRAALAGIMKGADALIHMAGYGPHLNERRYAIIRDNLLAMMAGGAMRNVVDKGNWF